MSSEIQRLAEDIVETYFSQNTENRLLIGVAGPAGCGKSTIAFPLTNRINDILITRSAASCEKAISAVCVSLDGWHYTRAQLDQMDDPVKAHWWRGAHFTFDQAGYRTFLDLLRIPLSSAPSEIPFPTFDHALKDPTLSPVPITHKDRLILIEGLYTLFDLSGWKECAEMMDFKIWVDVNEETARRRLVKRNFEAGIFDSLDACAARVDEVDMKNSEVLRAHASKPTHIFVSVDGQIY
ncbi:hypothetical protein J010_05247 [Cryptococcus neoformans]|nr:hypothetical protein C355_05287 [Cryptococcus neoformans var. grubii Th84]OXH04577.1 hypothetical protein J010_05247 [Cryptococcus neoformans var. grubii]OXH26374.1 hypothetical protein J009_05248 [Cryptococcus neoformans var. grubii]OXH46048.1 hypothetical protein J004_05303 [Cryptococcus neoformans var. grubii]OXH47062.1 hypothetical protein J003_05194 [Cryptococcus neoformans var. grubii]